MTSPGRQIHHQPIRIARIITRLNVGGPAHHASALSSQLPADRFHTLLLTGRPAEGEADNIELARRRGCHLVEIPAMSRRVGPIDDLNAFVQIVRILADYRPHIVHTHTAKAGTLGRLAAAMTGVPIRVHTFHGHVFSGYFPPPISTAIINAERILARMTDCVIAISDRQHRDLTERYRIAPASKVQTVELGLDLSALLAEHPRGAIRQKLGIPHDAFVFGMLGRLEPVKNPLLAVEAFLRLCTSRSAAFHRDVHLVIGGTGTQAGQLQDMIAHLGLVEHVHLVGLVRNVADFFADIDCMLLTSLNEGTPVALLEAQAAGVPSIATDVGGVADVADPRAVRLVPSNKIEPLVNAMTYMLNGGICKYLPDTVRNAIVRRFSTSRLTDDMIRLYEYLLRQKTTGVAGVRTR